MPDPTPPDPYRLAALAVLEAAKVRLIWDSGGPWVTDDDGDWYRVDLDAAARQMRAELEAAEVRGEARRAGGQ